ncbi:acyl--CoA ligase [Hoeflea sp. WL0058]|uniref:Acyl--CoA ligase n=1 Tax=Flavimaribacter sediminis TaxID=2865987 RepID=A0AAE3D3D9_9HYPH|nr:acyl--CoA ligase [Flavimaribacter sediminis]MBW8639548.1 acyl--CoA ligase [Flavimaribacter sediminis]
MANTDNLFLSSALASNDHPALLAPERPACSHAELRRSSKAVADQLAAVGVGRGDAVAIIMPNGPELVTVLLAAMSVASAAPLNPAYTESELRFYLEDLTAKLLICPATGFEAARLVASSLEIPVMTVDFDVASACGVVSMTAPNHAAATEKSAHNEADDVILLLHTSGTTAKPKLVGLSRGNIEASMANIRSGLELGPEDTGLCIMPLFHIHGIVATVLAPLSAGGSIVCTPGFNALQFFRWADAFRPSWYSAVPSMHQAIAARASRNTEIVGRLQLRFVRCSSAAMPIVTLEALEQIFRCPVIEAYGMTEAAHQITSNRLPPGDRKPGSVGWSATTRVAIMDDAGRLLGNGETGEIVIAGENIHAGYIDAPEANRASFADGWFRTGDQGRLDEDGCLTITGRLKEIINRGGEKIAPLELDNILLRHPDIVEAIAFAAPHAQLGEDIAAAIVRLENSRLGEDEVRAYLADEVAAFKIPRTILFVDEIPKGATGKIQRLNLAKQMGLSD